MDRKRRRTNKWISREEEKNKLKVSTGSR